MIRALRRRNVLDWAVVGLLLLATAALRWRLLAVPLERDEGEYAYGAQLLLQGIPPYAELYSLKLPGIFAAYAGILSVFGESVRGIHLGLLAVHAATIALVFVLGRRLGGREVGLVAALAFAALGLGQAVRGTVANAEHFVLLPALAGLALQLRAMERRSPLELGAAGLLLGIALLVKQHGAVFALAGGLHLVWGRPRLFQGARGALAWLGAFGAGVAAPYAATVAVFALVGAFESFWFWTMSYASFYVAQLGFVEAGARFADSSARVLRGAPLLWVLAAGGAAVLVFDRALGSRSRFLGVLTAASALSIVPGFYFRTHYYLLLLPAASLLVGVAVRSIDHILARRLPTGVCGLLVGGLVALAVGNTLVVHGDFLFRYTPFQASRSAYGLNPFADSSQIAAIVSARTEPDDRIAVLGSEPQIYFYARRRASTGFIYMYPLSEDHPFAREMQRRLIREIEANPPQALVFARVGQSWGRHGGSGAKRVIAWFKRYRRRFERLAVVEPRWGETRVHRGRALTAANVGSPPAIDVYLRRR